MRSGSSPGATGVSRRRFVQPLAEAAGLAPLRYVGRPAASSPATGYPNKYRLQQQAIIDQAVGRVPDKTGA